MQTHLEWCAERVQRAGDRLAFATAMGWPTYTEECALAIATDDFRRAVEGR